jgi:Zn-dependent protease
VRLPQPKDIIDLQVREHLNPSAAGDYIIRLWYNRIIMLGLSIPQLISRLATLVIALTVHEFAHAWAANELGDDTPRLQGRLTLNPLAHLDVLGSLMLVFAGFGWAKPVPINPFAVRRRTPAGVMLVSVAGPLSNLLLAIAASIPIRMGLLQGSRSIAGILPSASGFLYEFIIINILLMLFNLIPLFPLDGEKVLEYFLPSSGKEFLYRMRPYGQFLLLGIFFLGPTLGINLFQFLIVTPAQWLFGLLV